MLKDGGNNKGSPRSFGGPPDTPPGLAPGHDARGCGDGLNGSANTMKPLDSVTATLPEAMRNLELPPLPAPSAEECGPAFWRLADGDRSVDISNSCFSGVCFASRCLVFGSHTAQQLTKFVRKYGSTADQVCEKAWSNS